MVRVVLKIFVYMRNLPVRDEESERIRDLERVCEGDWSSISRAAPSRGKGLIAGDYRVVYDDMIVLIARGDFCHASCLPCSFVLLSATSSLKSLARCNLWHQRQSPATRSRPLACVRSLY
jgi:hypothetical protein